MDPDAAFAELRSTFAEIEALVAGHHDTDDLDSTDSDSTDSGSDHDLDYLLDPDLGDDDYAVDLENVLDNFAEQLDDLRQWLRRGGHPPSNRLVGK